MYSNLQNIQIIGNWKWDYLCSVGL